MRIRRSDLLNSSMKRAQSLQMLEACAIPIFEYREQTSARFLMSASVGESILLLAGIRDCMLRVVV